MAFAPHQMLTAAELNGLLPSASAPSWATLAGKFDPATGAYNCNARTLGRFRQQKARAMAAADHLHISVLGDSIAMQASLTGPAYKETWPAKMRDYLLRTLNLTNCGTGVMPLWMLYEDFSFNTAFPLLSWNQAAGGVLHKADNMGIFGNNGVAIHSGASAPFTSMQLNPDSAQMVDEIWVYLMTDASDTLVEVTDGSATYKFQIPTYYGATPTALSGYTVVPCRDGYVRAPDPATQGGMRVARLNVPRQNNWTVKVLSKPNAVTYMTMIEAKDSNGGLRVSNLAQGGMSLSGLISASDDFSGLGGMAQGVDAVNADLAIIALMTNDWMGHTSVADFKAKLITLVQRQQHWAGPTTPSGSGIGAAGDVLLLISPTPDLTRFPAAGGNVPSNDLYMRAMYEVADETDVALVDQTWRWKTYQENVPLYRDGDGVHPNTSGHADIGLSVGAILAGI